MIWLYKDMVWVMSWFGCKGYGLGYVMVWLYKDMVWVMSWFGFITFVRSL